MPALNISIENDKGCTRFLRDDVLLLSLPVDCDWDAKVAITYALDSAYTAGRKDGRDAKAKEILEVLGIEE